MSLTPGTQIGRYEIVSLLGSGGMGEVYLAKDSQFPRQVALKILRKSEDGDRLKRFRQEARAVSTLNHPNILSIYEFGEHDDIYYFVTEFVRGKTLREVISEGGSKLKEAIEIAIQIGNALVFAHEEGVIHRDIKPENIMILSDGYVKVLDFGLAKFSETGKSLAADHQESTVSLINTKPGLITGTVHYMSPEQLRGQEIDGRADVWSLGVVLYEMVTGRRPFTGESVSDVIAAILTHPLPQFEQMPPAMEKILARAISKDREERYQSARDIAKDLRIFRNTLSSQADTVSRDWKISLKQPDNPDRRVGNSKILRWSMPLLLLLLVSGIGGWLYFNGTPPPPQIVQKIRKPKPLSTTGNVLDAVLSPDGNSYAYIHEENGDQSLRRRAVDGGGEDILIPADGGSFGGLQFSPDKKSIFCSIFRKGGVGGLFRVSTSGGRTKEITGDPDSTLAISPDGKKLAFIRTRNHDGIDEVVVANVDGSEQNVLSERKYPAHYAISKDLREGLAWSPDGKTIACAAGTQDESGEKMTVVKIDVATGTEIAFAPHSWFRVGKVLWSGNRKDLVITAADFGTTLYQVLRISGEDGQVKERITTDLNDYLNISFPSDFRSLMTVADNRASGLYVTSEGTNITTAIVAGNLQGIGGLAWTPEGRILYVSAESGNRDIWIVDSNGRNPHSLTNEPAPDEYPSISADGRTIAFLSSRTGNPHIWEMKADGSDPRQLTEKGNEDFPQITPDGKWVFYTEKPLKIWKVSTENKNSELLTETPANWIAVSPDGSKVAGITLGMEAYHLAIFSTADRGQIGSFDIKGGVEGPRFTPFFRWAPDGKAIGYIATENGVSNIMVQSISGGKPKKLTDFSVDRIFAFDWSKDGSKIAIARGKADNKLALWENF